SIAYSYASSLSDLLSNLIQSRIGSHDLLVQLPQGAKRFSLQLSRDSYASKQSSPMARPRKKFISRIAKRSQPKERNVAEEVSQIDRATPFRQWLARSVEKLP